MNGNVKMEKSKQLNILNNVRLDRGGGGGGTFYISWDDMIE